MGTLFLIRNERNVIFLELIEYISYYFMAINSLLEIILDFQIFQIINS